MWEEAAINFMVSKFFYEVQYGWALIDKKGISARRNHKFKVPKGKEICLFPQDQKDQKNGKLRWDGVSD